MSERYRVARLEDVKSPVAPDPGAYEWKPIRRHLGIRAFGVNAQVAHRAGDLVVEEHTEIQANAAHHEELYIVTGGHARFTIDGEEVDAPAGTFLFVPDPASRRVAWAVVDGTTVVAVGARAGVAFEISPWERKYLDD